MGLFHYLEASLIQNMFFLFRYQSPNDTRAMEQGRRETPVEEDAVVCCCHATRSGSTG